MTRRRRRILAGVGVGVLVAAVLTLLSITPSDFDGRYTINVDLAGGKAEIEAELRNLRHPFLVLWLFSDEKRTGTTRFEVLDEEGDSMAFIDGGRWKLLFPMFSDRVRLRYDATLGVKGRHGFQGVIEPDFALLQTSLLIWMPSPYWVADQIHVRVNAPEGADVVFAWPRDEEGWHSIDIEGVPVFYPVLKSAIGVGDFDVTDVEIYGQRFQIATHQKLGPERRERILKRNKLIFAHLQELLGFELHTPYVNIFVPSPTGGARVFGASWTLGQCYEMEPDDLRRWELYAHRIGHIFNRDAPYGLTIGKDGDRWFYEALASWIEIPLSEVAGAVSNDRRFGTLHRRYWRMREKEGPLYDRRPFEDRWTRNHDVTEWLHYTKYPLLLMMLDWELRGPDGDPRQGVEGFFAHLYKKYGNHAAPIPDLEDELEAFTGRDLGWFFRRYIESDWPILPLYRSFLERARERLTRLKVIAHLQGRPVYGDAMLKRLLPRNPERARAHAREQLHDLAEDVLIDELGLRVLRPEVMELVVTMPKTDREAFAEYRERVLQEYLSGPGCAISRDVDAWVDEQLAEMKLTWEPGFESLGAAAP